MEADVAPSVLSRSPVVGGWALAVSALMLVSLIPQIHTRINPTTSATDLPQRLLYVLGLTAKALIVQRWLRATRHPGPEAARSHQLLMAATIPWVAFNTCLLLAPATIADRSLVYQADALLTIVFGLNVLVAAPTQPASDRHEL